MPKARICIKLVSIKHWRQKMTTIRYFVPEDGDDESYPNVFLAPKSRQPGSPPTLEQIRNAFPLPGSYHFRFKSPLIPGGDREKGAMAVWMDLTQDGATVPTWKNTIVAKVCRTGVEDDDDDDDDFPSHEPVRSPAPVPAPAPAPTPARSVASAAPSSNHGSMHTAGSSDHLDIFDSSVGSAPTSTGAPNFLDSHQAPAQAYPSGGSALLDMNNGYGRSQPPAPNAGHNDFLGMSHAPPPSQNGYGQGVAPAPSSYGAPQQQQQQQPPQQQQQQQQQQGSNAFNSFSNQQGPFGGLGTPWK